MGPFDQHIKQTNRNRQRLQGITPSIFRPLPTSCPHTYGVISVYNVGLGTDGKVWLLDGDFAGKYPHRFEYASIMAYASGRKDYDPPRG